MSTSSRRTLLALPAALALAACGGDPLRAGPSASPTPREPLLVLAASDLQYAMSDVAAEYERTGRRKPTLTFGSTGTFASQIKNGAPADLFFAADQSFLADLDAAGLVLPGTRHLYAAGRITLAAARGAPVEAASLADLLRPEVKKVAIANPEHAPYGQAAQQALQATGLWERVQPKLVLAENISQTFQLVQTGNADAGIVALSIVLGAPGATYTLIDAALHAPLRQAAAVLKASRQPDAARAFLAFVNGPLGRPTMKRYGFVLPGE
ncbi:MAG TPA: molybdate ABC transporter substrate-binding protein [Chloroflexota bacterium]|nr:molybdate ABC transporter substrate-binding protein [Chloroflexota bacterium]